MGIELPATVITFEIYIVDNEALSAQLVLDVDGKPHIFGGKDMFSFWLGDYDFMGHFSRRCMEITQSKSTIEMIGKLIEVVLLDGIIVTIANDVDSFTPLHDIGLMKGEVI